LNGKIWRGKHYAAREIGSTAFDMVDIPGTDGFRWLAVRNVQVESESVAFASAKGAGA